MKKLYTGLFFLMAFSVIGQAQLVIFGDAFGAGISFVPFGGSANNLTTTTLLPDLAPLELHHSK